MCNFVNPILGHDKKKNIWHECRMGNNLKKLREEANLTHAEAAEKMNISRSQFIKLERGERRLTSDYINLASKAFNVPKSRIISNEMVPVIGYVGGWIRCSHRSARSRRL